MGIPASPEARLFYRSALQRRDDARFLLSGDRTTASIYLAGYAIECILKALILGSVPKRKSKATMALFRGAKAHDFEWLRAEYVRRAGSMVPPLIARSMSQVYTWSTDLRYRPGTTRRREVVRFLAAADAILEWADGRL